MGVTQEPALADRWDDAVAAPLGAADLLVYRSNLLGADLAVTNFGGGNTSAKLTERDPLTGEAVEVLWVKGSGGDLGSMGKGGFATLYQAKLLSLRARYRGRAHEDAMVALFDHCIFNRNPRAPSIDTPLHAFVPYTHVDHVHPDAVIALAASKDSARLTQEVFEGRLGYLPWQRPGFDLGLKIGRLAEDNPGLDGVVLGGHGLFTWHSEAKACYRLTMAIIRQASEWLQKNRTRPAFGVVRRPALVKPARDALAARLMPSIRGRIGGDSAKVGHFSDAPEVLDFVGSDALDRLAPLGTSCPDHFLRTKIRPLVLPDLDPEAAVPDIDTLLASYRADYAAYYARCKRERSPAMRDPNAVVYLAPGVGMMTFAANKTTARIAAEFYTNAINVMRGAEGVGTYVGLDEQEAFDIEYWLLEEAKLQRLPKPKSLAGRVALVTGAAGGIGQAICRRLLADGACVLATDINAEALGESVAAFRAQFGADNTVGFVADVTDETAVAAAFAKAAQDFGGLDIVVSNAGIASAAAIEETSLALWNRNQAILGTGYFLVTREAFRLLKAQGTGGAIVFIASKNGLAASAGASAYGTAKAAEIHLARCAALEGAPHGIRVNTVNPDAVLRGSRIWQGDWRAQRAASYGVETDALEEVYRNRALLKLSVYPEDVAEAVRFLAGPDSAKSTGNIVNVDAGNALAFPR
ncbi:MAG: bifunctional rhamnulose-1-phosphate aldolase/short-chain dehydrogenase [Pseudomonadota bacterium]